MNRIALEYSEIVSGAATDFSLVGRKRRNLLLVFQVNCPGCFLYALPIAAGLHRDLIHADVRILGLSTAFEDFEWNTLENTRALIQEGRLVGETEKAFAMQDIRALPFALDFPVAFDSLRPSSDFSDEDFRAIAEAQPGYHTLPLSRRPGFIARVREHYQRQELLPATFTKNALAGTPSWIVYDAAGNILHSEFGHPRDIQVLADALLTPDDTAAGGQ
ncbi:MAG: hypothetical protein NXI24_11885 [bacterium]|nr:hypothetical protein [bacterium]